MINSITIQSADREYQLLKKELSDLEIKLQSLSDKKNEYLRDIEDFNLQYTLYLGELIENILRLKKDILYKKTQSMNNQESYAETNKIIAQIQEALFRLENTLNILDKSDTRYEETFQLYNELQEELKTYNEQLNSLEDQLYSFDHIENYQSQYDFAKKEYQEYYKEYSQIKDEEQKFSLNETEKLELKSLWKKACKLCHPDIVSDNLKEKAHEIMQLLNEAYSKKDIEKVKSILKDLENSNFFKIISNEIDDLKLIKLKIEEYQNKIKNLQFEIENIKNDETFEIISDKTKWEQYFRDIKLNLTTQKQSLESEVKKLRNEIHEYFDLYLFSKNIVNITSQDKFEQYLESCYSEFENFFQSKDFKELHTDIEIILEIINQNNVIKNNSSKIINSFIILLAQFCEQTDSISLVNNLLKYLPEGSFKLQFEAKLIYITKNNYSDELIKILNLLQDSARIDEYNTKAIKAFLYFFQESLQQFQKTQNEIFAKELINTLIEQKLNFEFLQDNFLVGFFETISDFNIPQSLELVAQHLEQISSKITICNPDTLNIIMESSSYSQALKNLKHPTFETIRNISFHYIHSIGDPQELYDRLQRGEKIIDDENLLYKYLTSFGSKHKQKLDSAFELIIDKIKNKKFDIVDWGCGQATATMSLLDYAKKRNITLEIENITLIEPSALALSRGLLHIDVLKQKSYNIKAINCDFDCLDETQIITLMPTTLHLFSNILDLESFSLGNIFFKKVSNILTDDSIFVCVSPNRNDKLNSRLDHFYNYFNENFDTSLISSRNSDINGHKRYEKIFTVRRASQEISEIQATLTTPHIYQTLIAELDQYKQHISPILDVDNLEMAMQNDPEYIIFKVRKVADSLTTKIYARYESNLESISFSDKIRYLSYQNKVLTKTMKNYLQTIRTIGNVGVHEERSDFNTQEYDAHMMLFALISLVKELCERKFI